MRNYSWIVILVCLLSCRYAAADTVSKVLAPGVVFTQEINQTIPLIINVMTVDLDVPGVHVGVGVGQDRISGDDGRVGREGVDHLARRYSALAAVNADYFPFTGDPLGVGIRDGELFSEPWVATPKIGSRRAMGIGESGHRVSFETLGFLGDLQTADAGRIALNGINRAMGKNEIVVFTTIYGNRTAIKPGGTEVVLRRVNLPVAADKLMTGQVEAIRTNVSSPGQIPANGVVLCGGAGAGSDFLIRHCRVGETLEFVLAVAPVNEELDGIKIATTQMKVAGNLPSRGGEGIARRAYWWSRVQQAVGGGPRLLHNGEVSIDAQDEGFPPAFTDMPHPRTAVGSSADGHHLILVTVDGRQSISRGVSLADLARILKRYGAAEAMNLDGGGSTTMSVAGLVVSSPSGGGSERPVADMLLVFSDKNSVSVPTPYRPRMAGVRTSDGGAAVTITAGEPAPSQDSVDSGIRISTGEPGAGDSSSEMQESAQLEVPSPVLVGSTTLVHLYRNQIAVAGDIGSIVWQGPVSSIGFVNQKGYFYAMKAGSGIITAVDRGQEIHIPITVVEKLPAFEKPPLVVAKTIQAKLVPDTEKPQSFGQLQLQMTWPDGKPCAGETIHVVVIGGAADKVDLQTDIDGDANVGIAWSAARGGSVVLSAGSSPKVTIERPELPIENPQPGEKP